MAKAYTSAEKAARARRSAKRARITGSVFIGLAFLFVIAAVWLMTQGQWQQGVTTLTSTIITAGSGFFIRFTASSFDDTAKRWDRLAAAGY